MKNLKNTREIMGMPITVEIICKQDLHDTLEEVFTYFRHVDEVFSTYKTTSEVSRINRNELSLANASAEVQYVYAAADNTNEITGGYFNHRTPDGTIDPSGIVKGWSIQQAAILLKKRGCKNFCIEAGGDIQTCGTNVHDKQWSIGIRHPFEQDKFVKKIYLHNEGVATSGTYLRGKHIYNPTTNAPVVTPFISITVVGQDIYDADRFATAAFAMGANGLYFVEALPGYEGYAITNDGLAKTTSRFNHYTNP